MTDPLLEIQYLFLETCFVYNYIHYQPIENVYTLEPQITGGVGIIARVGHCNNKEGGGGGVEGLEKIV